MSQIKQLTKQSTREGFSEVRNDEEEKGKIFGEIVEILLAAGYFRARINGLTPFDKVIGGLAWAITASNVDVDVDIFFQEEAQLGTKIKLGEVIVRSLIKMKCPHPLQTYQIQGLDYASIFPVIQWLIKIVVETREETGDLIRKYSEFQFNRDLKLPEDAEFEARKFGATAYVEDVMKRYKPRRQYKRVNIDSKQEEERVQSTLLEYGHLYKASKQLDPDKTKKTSRFKHSSSWSKYC